MTLRDDLIAIATETIAALDPAALLQETCRLTDNRLQVGEGLVAIDQWDEGAASTSASKASPTRETPPLASETPLANEMPPASEPPLASEPPSAHKAPSASYDLSAFSKVFIAAIGKAAEPMARYLLKTLAIRVDDGVIITKERRHRQIEGIDVRLGGHPLPTAASVRGGEALVALAERADEDTLVINCISGGASALCCAPWRDDTLAITLDDYRAMTQLLLDNAVPIEQSNCVRSQLSRIKGGRYLGLLQPALSLSFILSDVRYDDLRAIGSGLTASGMCSRAQAMDILRSYDLWERAPERIRRLLSATQPQSQPIATRSTSPSATSTQSHTLARNRNIIIGNTRRALLAAADVATARGYTPLIVTDSLFGEAAAAAAHLVAIAAYHLRYRAPRERLCILFGGETTVTVRGDGLGGRNQELAAAFLKIASADALLTRHAQHIAMISFATDGNDGPTDAAGGIVDARSLQLSALRAIDIEGALANNDSYHLLQQVDSLYKSGYSATNVCDVQCILISCMPPSPPATPSHGANTDPSARPPTPPPFAHIHGE